MVYNHQYYEKNKFGLIFHFDSIFKCNQHNKVRLQLTTQSRCCTKLSICLCTKTFLGIRKVKPSWILPKQETESGSGISWAICKSASRSRQITTPAPHYSVFTDWMPFLLPNQQHKSFATKGLLNLLHDLCCYTHTHTHTHTLLLLKYLTPPFWT